MRKIDYFLKKYKYWMFKPRCYFKDGFSVSIQASSFHYCIPQENELNKYEYVELGFPSEKDCWLTQFAEDKDNLTETVYPFVPCYIVEKMITEHKGIDYIKTNKGRKKNI